MVTHAVLRNDIEAQLRVADEVARGLACASIEGCDVLIHTPITFPSGRMIGVKLLGGPATFTITDDGSTMREAEMMGAIDICRREAKKIAAEYDLRFNDWELFEVDAPFDRLVGAAVIVANAAALAMIRTADKFAERFDLRRREALAVRLERIFGKKKVSQDVEVLGAAKKWHFDARVELLSGRPGLFSVVTPTPVSVIFAYSKMDDVSRIDNAPFLGAVLEGKFGPDDKALLKRAARRVFESSDSDEAFRLAA
jgi:hypothetical protein